MGNKQQKKIRQLVRRKEKEIAENVQQTMQPILINQSWDCFFQTISEMKLKYRLKLAWQIITGKNIREVEQKKALKKEK